MDDFGYKFKLLVDDFGYKCKLLVDDFGYKCKLLVDDFGYKCKLVNDFVIFNAPTYLCSVGLCSDIGCHLPQILTWPLLYGGQVVTMSVSLSLMIRWRGAVPGAMSWPLLTKTPSGSRGQQTLQW